MSNLSPCKLCKGIETQLIPRQYWTGMSYKPLSVEIHHWCSNPDSDSFVKNSISMRARTEEQAIEVWNRLNE